MSCQKNWGQVQELKTDQKLYLTSYCKQLVERTCTVNQWNEVRALPQDPQCTALRMREGNRDLVCHICGKLCEGITSVARLKPTRQIVTF